MSNHILISPVKKVPEGPGGNRWESAWKFPTSSFAVCLAMNSKLKIIDLKAMQHDVCDVTKHDKMMKCAKKWTINMLNVLLINSLLHAVDANTATGCRFILLCCRSRVD
jgi:hypothetical protein